MKEKELAREVQLRAVAKHHLALNPNYFGNLTDLKLPGFEKLPGPVLKKMGDRSFEELTCIGYNPETEILTAIVRIKQEAGYSGGPCTDGSQEYVRFYLDYGDGTWVDHGMAGFNIHDLGCEEDLCYAVSIKIDPEKRTCCDRDPVLPTVRAILSWNTQPPPNMPDWIPVWGNRQTCDIQIDPRNWFLCNLIDILDVGIQKIDPVLAKQATAALSALPKPQIAADATVEIKKAIESKDEIAVLRNVFPLVAKQSKIALSAEALLLPDLVSQFDFDIDLAPFDDFIANPKFNTSYEELHCVGLDRDESLLHGVIKIKRPSGYSGDLCTNGSREYIAFYLDFGSGWEYQGTTWVDVYNIAQIPQDGLWYQASLPVDLEPHQQEWCETGKARIRGILSWNTAPTPNDPDYVAHWGDWEECDIEIKPLPEGVTPGATTPVLEAIGSMPVDRIDGAGYANGDNIGNTLTADDAPFGGVIKMSGVVAFAGATNLEYRIMVQGPSDAVPKAWTQSFDIYVTTVAGGSVTFANQTQVANGDWFTYVPQTGAVFKSVAENLLARFTATEDGLHTVYMEIRDAGTLAVLGSTAPEAFVVDNTRPVVNIDITNGGGNCGKFNVGDPIKGIFSMSDAHSGSLTLGVTPGAAANGAVPTIDPANVTNTLTYAAGTLPTGGTSGTWTLDTNGMDPCGFNVRIDARDRTIVNSGSIGWPASDIEGFCLD